MENLTGLLEKYEVDPRATMPRFANDEKLYIRCFEMFARDPNFERLGQALAEKRYEDAFFAAHTLKGVAGNMGFTRLFDTVCEIVEPLRAKKTDTDYDSLYRRVGAEYERIKALKTEVDRL